MSTRNESADARSTATDHVDVLCAVISWRDLRLRFRVEGLGFRV